MNDCVTPESRHVLVRSVFLVLIGVLCSRVDAAEEQAHRARASEHLKCGRYDDAISAYREVLSDASRSPDDLQEATLGLSEALEARGLWDRAAETVADALGKWPRDADLLARTAELQLRRGDYSSSESSSAAALAIDSEHLRARLVQAHTFAETGRLDAALQEYRWFVRFYNAHQPTDAASLMYVAEGALQYARWKSVSPIFEFVINTLCPDALKDDPLCWQAAHLSGAVLLEKYNRAQALPELEAALKINARAAEVLVSQGTAALQESELSRAADLAKEALAINPRLPSALQLAAEISLVAGDPEAAKTFIESALQVNPHDQRTLAQQAAVFLLEDGIPSGPQWASLLGGKQSPEPADEQFRFGALWRDLVQRNPRPGPFLTRVGDMLDGRRRYAAAEVCYRQAIALMPQLSEPRTELGMLLMRVGRLDEASTILDEAFKADPYHVRVSNMRKVVRQLEGYDLISSDHFVIRVPQDERVLGEEMSRYLEEIYDELTTTYGYEPETRTQFEVLGPTRGQSAHQWFSARMVGLPWVQTIGASTGMIVAMASPHDQPEPFNWARVVRHEFVHILTLQQTDFNIPHWYTEALAVRTEGAIPESWDVLLLQRVPENEVFSLDDINRGFTRPDGPTDWNMAYCQSWLYAQFIAERFGEDALIGLVDAYHRNLSTPEAIQEVCGISIHDFELAYTESLQSYVDEIRRERGAPPMSVDSATAAWKENPDDRNAWAEVAWSLWHAGDRRQAREIALEIHAMSPSQPLAVAILAEGASAEGDIAAAERLLRAAFDTANPHPALLERLAALQAQNGDVAAARDLWEQGVRRWPRAPQFLRGLASALLRLGDDVRLRKVLMALAERDVDDGLVRKKLAQLALEDGDWSEAIRWGNEASYCDVRDPAIHRLLSSACEHAGDAEGAVRHADLAQRLEAAAE